MMVYQYSLNCKFIKGFWAYMPLFQHVWVSFISLFSSSFLFPTLAIDPKSEETLGKTFERENFVLQSLSLANTSPFTPGNRVRWHILAIILHNVVLLHGPYFLTSLQSSVASGSWVDMTAAIPGVAFSNFPCHFLFVGWGKDVSNTTTRGLSLWINVWVSVFWSATLIQTLYELKSFIYVSLVTWGLFFMYLVFH